MNEGKIELVDLGLPSGTLWAACNLGAKGFWEKGNYYAWAEIEPKKIYNASTSIAYGKSPDEFKNQIFGGIPEYDAATHHDSELSMPTMEDFKELVDNCEKLIAQYDNGAIGVQFTGPNGNSIFLPYGGEINNDYVVYEGQYGFYWSCWPYPSSIETYGFCLWIGEQGANFYWLKKYTGASIRPIKRKKED